MVKIEHLGKIFSPTQFSGRICGDVVRYYRANYYPEATKEQAKTALEKVAKGGVNIQPVNAYFFDRLKGDTKRYSSKWSVNEFLQSDALIQYAHEYVLRHPEFFRKSTIENFRMALRIGMGGIASTAAHFPFSDARRRLSTHRSTHNNVYIDTSCGWGTRMIAGASLGLDYVGFEVNPPLIKKLKELGNMLQGVFPEWKYRIIEHGSEFFVPDLAGKAGVMMTSPPYYFLEDYRHGRQSCTANTSFDEWCDSFLYPTLDNSFKYICNEGKVLLNIKNYGKYNLAERTEAYGRSKGYTVSYDSVKLSVRPQKKHVGKQRPHNKEKVIIFSINNK